MNNNNIEIERRFILRERPAEQPQEEYELFQKYSNDGWRYRRQANGSEVRYFKTRKTAIASGVNNEEEHEITQHDFDSNCGIPKKAISKTRSVFHHDGLRFEVDTFHNIHLVIMEVELDDINQDFVIPDFLLNSIIYEITGIKEFSNSSLASPIIYS